MVPSCLDKQTAGSESLHDWLVRWDIDLPSSYYMWGLKQPELTPFELKLPATLWLPTTPTLHPIGVFVVY